MLESVASLVFAEVKMGAGPSAGTTSDPERDQLTRNLDVGYVGALRDKKQFALIYITPELAMPDNCGIRAECARFQPNLEGIGREFGSRYAGPIHTRSPERGG